MVCLPFLFLLNKIPKTPTPANPRTPIARYCSAVFHAGIAVQANATLGLVAGINPKVVSEALGHSSVTITLDLYSHVLPNMQDELAGAIANLLKQGTSVD